MGNTRIEYVCAKHGIPFKFMTICGAEIPYCEFCTESGLMKKKPHWGNTNLKLVRNINQDREKILSEKAIWKGKEYLSLKKRPYIKKHSMEINHILNRERKARIKKMGVMGKPT